DRSIASQEHTGLRHGIPFHFFAESPLVCGGSRTSTREAGPLGSETRTDDALGSVTRTLGDWVTAGRLTWTPDEGVAGSSTRVPLAASAWEAASTTWATLRSAPMLPSVALRRASTIRNCPIAGLALSKDTGACTLDVTNVTCTCSPCAAMRAWPSCTLASALSEFM